MSVYLDASVLVSLFTNDALTNRADRFLQASLPILIVSDFAAAEFASAIARGVRMRSLTENEAHTVFSIFDAWTARATERVETMPADVRLAEVFLRRLDLPLRTPDALNVAIAQRLGATLATFDAKMETSAKALGADIALV